jgi:YbbR domain-containing protein
MSYEDLLIGILSSLIAMLLWTIINNYFVKNNKRSNKISTIDISNIEQEKPRYNNYQVILH